MKKNKIGVLISIVFLLCIFLPGAIYGTYMHYKNEALGGNINKEFYYEGKLYFYNNDKLLGIYQCKTHNCNYAKNSIHNEEFEEFNKEETIIKTINNKYAFIEDGDKIVLFDIEKESSIIEYKEIKNYSIGIDGNYYLVKNNADLWGLIKVENSISVAIPNTYKYLGLTNKLSENNKLDASKLIAKTDSEWQLITKQNNIVLSSNELITDYSNYFVITSDSNKHIFNYSRENILGSYVVKDVQLFDSIAIAFIENINMYMIYSAKTNTLIGTVPNSLNNDITFAVENETLLIKENNETIKTIALV